jgi:hypothetical protein
LKGFDVSCWGTADTSGNPLISEFDPQQTSGFASSVDLAHSPIETGVRPAPRRMALAMEEKYHEAVVAAFGRFHHD